MRKAQTIEQVTAAIKKWRTKLKRSISMIEKLERQEKRLRAAAAKVQVAPPKPIMEAKPIVEELRTTANDLDIPGFLRRQEPDPGIEQVKAEIEDVKRRKARGRIEKMKAKQRGDLSKMPLTGKAALDAIRNS